MGRTRASEGSGAPGGLHGARTAGGLRNSQDLQRARPGDGPQSAAAPSRSPASATGRVPTEVGALARSLAVGLIALSAAIPAVPADAQTVTPPSAPQNLAVDAGDGLIRPRFSPGALGTSFHYQYRYAAGDSVPDATTWSDSTNYNRTHASLVTGLTNGTTYAFELRARNSAGWGPAATATATPTRATCSAPDLGDRRQIWSALVTVGATRVNTLISGPRELFFGYYTGDSGQGAINSNRFTLGAYTYEVGSVGAENTYSDLTLKGVLEFSITNHDFSSAQRSALRLHVCDESYDLATDSVYVFSSPEQVQRIDNHFATYWSHFGTDSPYDEFDWALYADRTVYLSLTPNRPATGGPVVSGERRVGGRLTASTSGIADADGLTLAASGEPGFAYGYQWYREDPDGTSRSAIPGATDSVYTFTEADRGRRLKVRVSFTDDLNSSEAVESGAFALTNSPPTASDGRVSVLASRSHVFDAGDFNYSDPDGDPLASVRIVSLPAGRSAADRALLELDGAEPREGARVTRAQLDAGELVYTPPADGGEASFDFSVSDGRAESAVHTLTMYTVVYRPGPVRTLTATPGDREVKLTWREPGLDSGTPVTDYEYRYEEGDSVPRDTPWQSAGLGRRQTVTGLTNGVQHAFDVRARNSVGTGELVTALATPVGPPERPGTLTATPGDGEVMLAWSAPDDDNGAPVTEFEYRYAPARRCRRTRPGARPG